jgi:hypothetical protein
MPNPLYLVECSYGRLGNAFRETDRDTNNRKEVEALIRSGEIKAIKVLEIDEDAGTCRNVTDEFPIKEVEEARDLAHIRACLDSAQGNAWDQKRKLLQMGGL